MISFYCGPSLQHCWEMQQGQDSWWQSWASGRGAAAGMATPLSGDTVAPQWVPTSALAPQWRCGHLPGETEGAASLPKGSRAQDRHPTTRQKKINLKKWWADTKILLCALPVCHFWEHLDIPDSLQGALFLWGLIILGMGITVNNTNGELP